MYTPEGFQFKGGTLQDLLTGLQLGVIKHPLGELLEIVMKVCDALSYAHSRGVVHRDLKPFNIALEAGEFGGGIRKDFWNTMGVALEEGAPFCEGLRTALCC